MMQRAVEKVRVDDSLRNYALDIVERTRNSEQLTLGVSPRGLLMLQRAAQARAFLEGARLLHAGRFQAAHPAGVRAPRGGQHALRGDAEKIDAGGNDPSRNHGNHSRPPLMNPEFVERRVGPPLLRKAVGISRAAQWNRLRQTLDTPSWRSFRHRHGRSGDGAFPGAVFRRGGRRRAICWSRECRRCRRWRWPAGSR